MKVKNHIMFTCSFAHSSTGVLVNWCGFFSVGRGGLLPF